MPQPYNHVQHECDEFSERLGQDYRRLYQLEESGAEPEEIAKAKALIESDKAKLKYSVKRLNEQSACNQ